MTRQTLPPLIEVYDGAMLNDCCTDNTSTHRISHPAIRPRYPVARMKNSEVGAA